MYWRGGPAADGRLQRHRLRGRGPRRRDRHQLDQLPSHPALGAGAVGGRARPRGRRRARLRPPPRRDLRSPVGQRPLLGPERPAPAHEGGRRAARLVVPDHPAQRRRELLRPGIGGLHRLRRPVRLEAEHPADLPAGRLRRRRRHRRALHGRARAGRERAGGGRRGHVDRSRDRPHGPRDGARAAGRGRGRVARVARAAAALADRRPGGRELPADPSLHRAVRHLRRGPGRLVGPAAGRARGRVRSRRGRIRLPDRDDAVRARRWSAPRCRSPTPAGTRR